MLNNNNLAVKGASCAPEQTGHTARTTLTSGLINHARSNDNVSDVEIKLAYRGDSHLIAMIQRLYSVETERLVSYNVP